MSPFSCKVKTASGTMAVQIVEKQDRVNRVSKHLGSAHGEARLAISFEIGRKELCPGQLELDLNSLDTGSYSTPEMQYQSSALLWAVLRGAYRAVRFDQAISDNTLEQLVLARIVGPASKPGIIRILGELGVEVAHRNTFNDYLQHYAGRDYHSRLAEACFTHTSKSGGLSLVLYDVTTLYFEAEYEDEDSGENQGLRRVGYLRGRRVDPQTVVDLLVDRSGFPLEIGCFEGSKAEIRTLLLVIRRFQDHHGLDSFVVVAGADIFNNKNLEALGAAGLKFIVGSRQTRASHGLESHFHWNGGYFVNSQTIDTVAPRHANSKVNNKKLKVEPVWDPVMGTSWRVVWQYSAKRAGRDSVILEAQRRRALGAVDGIKPARRPRFVKTTRSGCSFDKKAFERAQKLEGLKGYVTSFPATSMPVTEVIDSYREPWHMEQSFRMSKTGLRTHPIFHRQKNAIETHLAIVMTALAVSRYLYREARITPKKLIRTLRPLREVTISLPGRQQITAQSKISPETQKILDKPGH